MSMTIDERKEDLMKLPTNDRAALALFLIRSLDEVAADDPQEVENYWQGELERRWQEIESGKELGRPAEEVFTELRKKFS